MRLVVDACVLGSAGKSEDVCSVTCRKTLDGIREARHSVHYDSLLQEEWSAHISSYAIRWRASMMARGLLVFVRARKPDQGLARAVKLQLADRSAHKSALKDIHLIVLALHADKAILSRDGTARGLFVKVGEGERRLRRLLWIDPTQHPAEALSWLRNESEALGQWRLTDSEPAE